MGFVSSSLSQESEWRVLDSIKKRVRCGVVFVGVF